MNKYLDYLLEVLSKFAGGRGEPTGDIVLHGLAGAMWLGLLLMARARRREHETPRERLLVWGFAVGLGREAFMFAVISLRALGLVDPARLHVVFPPLEHALFDGAVLLVAAAFLRYLLPDPRTARWFLPAALAAVAGVYLATFWWWGRYILAHPDSKFGQTWCDWAFRINASAWLAAATVLMALRGSGRHRGATVAALSLALLYQLLKLPDMALGERYKDLFTPVRHSFYLWAVLLLGFVYVREQFELRRRTEQEVLAVGDRERRRIGRDLHDALGGQLVGIAALSKALQNRLQRAGHPEADRAGEITRAANEAMRSARRLARGLRPVGGLPEGLEAALGELARNAAERFGIACTVRCRDAAGCDDRLAEQLFRIAQEALTNAARHGRARNVEIDLARRGAALVLTVADDGVGLRPGRNGEGGMGLRIMGYRAAMLGGTFEIRARPGGGTLVRCVVPVGAEGPAGEKIDGRI